MVLLNFAIIYRHLWALIHVVNSTLPPVMCFTIRLKMAYGLRVKQSGNMCHAGAKNYHYGELTAIAWYGDIP